MVARALARHRLSRRRRVLLAAVALPGIVLGTLLAQDGDSSSPTAAAEPDSSDAASPGSASHVAPVLPLDGSSGEGPPVEVDLTGLGPAPGPPPAAGGALAATSAPEARGRGVWAVVIGINDYPGADADLKNAVNDASEVVRLLDRMGAPATQRQVLLESHATSQAIRTALDWLTANAGPEATAVVFYAGHVLKVAPGREAVVGADGRDLLDVEIRDRLDRLAAGRTWLIFAACYAEGFEEAMRPGRILTGASGRDSLAFEDPRMGRSYLVEYMVRRAILQGRADQSVEQAFAWAVEALRRDHPNRLPVQHDAVDGDFPIDPVPPPRPTCTTLPLVTTCSGPQP